MARQPTTIIQPLDAGLEEPLAWAEEFRYLGVTFHMAPDGELTQRQAPQPPLSGVAFQLLLLHEILKCPAAGVRFTSPKLYHTGIHLVVLAQALYAAPIIDINTKRLDHMINKFARRQFGLPPDTSTVFLRTQLDILPADYLVWRGRLRFALTFFCSPFFQRCVKPLLTPPYSYFLHVNICRSLDWLTAALVRAGLSFDRMLAMADDPALTSAAWAQETTRIIRSNYAETWPQVATTGKAVEGPLKSHLEMVCFRLHSDAERAHPNPITRYLPCGLPLYVKLGGIYACIGLVFKAFGLRPAFASGVQHHERAACFWCHVPGTECGVHLLPPRSGP